MVAWIQFFVFSARWYYSYICLENFWDLGKETLGRELDPALLGISNYVYTTEFLSLDEQIWGRLV